MNFLLIVILFACIAVVVYVVAATTMAGNSVLQQRLRAALGTAAEAPPKPQLAERAEQLLEPLSKALPRSEEEVSRTRALLIQAGYREPRHVTIFFGLRVLLAGLGAALAIFTGGAFRSPLFLVACILLGFILPRFGLKRLITRRQHTIRLSMPDALDLAVICVEAGLSLDQALNRVSQELYTVHPELSSELRLVNLEIRAGKARAEALRNLAFRTGVDDMRSLVAVLLQTDRFGTSIAQALRVHSDALRTERRQRAEEAAAKTTIKMVPVLVFFVFPPLFFVTVGPAIIQLVRTVLPEISQ